MTGELPNPEQFQQALAETPSRTHTFLSGYTGTGKTCAGEPRLMAILANGAWDESVFVPHRSLGELYFSAAQEARSGPERVRVQTLAGLARRSIELFWPLVAEEAGFQTPSEPPTFLTIETAQYFMAKATVIIGGRSPQIIGLGSPLNMSIDVPSWAVTTGGTHAEEGGLRGDQGLEEARRLPEGHCS